MNKPCDICIEEKCEGRHDCDCKNCKIASQCYRTLHPTIRITNKCTQQCSHCCFSSHPKSNIMMTIEQSEKTAQFLKNNEIGIVNLMGGEFFCNPNWFDIFSNIVSVVRSARIVTNGDWSNSESVKKQLEEFVFKFKDKIHFSISKDKWHTNKNVEAAAEFFDKLGIKYNVATEEETKDDSIVPVGRGMLSGSFGVYSMFGCYCHNPKNMYSFLIDEDGDIYKCGFGILRYDNIDDYLTGGFNKRFKEFNMKFHKEFISSCAACVRSIMIYDGSEKYEKLIVSNK